MRSQTIENTKENPPFLELTPERGIPFFLIE